MTSPAHPTGKVVAADRPTLHLEYLDALRGVAILAVIWVHAAMSVDPAAYSALEQIAFLGQRGVQLFYLISAFTLFYTLDSARREHYRITNFYLRRFFRIAPLFYCVLIFNLLVYGLGGLRWQIYLSCFFFLNGLSHSGMSGGAPGGWSIAVESSFYILLPLLYARIRTLSQSLLAFCISAVVLTPLSWHLARTRSPQEYYSFLWFPVEFPVFLLGIIAYMIWKTAIVPALAAGLTVARRRTFSALLLLLTAGILIGTLNLHPPPSLIPWRNTHLLPASLMFLPLILALSLYEWRILVNPFTRFMGKISFSVYLTHLFVMQGIFWALLRNHNALGASLLAHLHSDLWSAAVVFVCLTGACIPICTLLWRYIEQPGIRLGRRIIARHEHIVARRAAPLVPPLEEIVRPGNTPDAQF